MLLGGSIPSASLIDWMDTTKRGGQIENVGIHPADDDDAGITVTLEIEAASALFAQFYIAFENAST